jgi:hypothetical protein
MPIQATYRHHLQNLTSRNSSCENVLKLSSVPSITRNLTQLEKDLY